MRNALIYCVMLSCGLSLCVQVSAQEPAPVTLDGRNVMASGKTVHMKGSFLEQLQERDSVLIADQLFYGFELKQVEAGTMFAFPQIEDTLMVNIRVVKPWSLDTIKVAKQKKGQPELLDLRAGLTVTSFDEGIYHLPPLAVLRLSKDGVADTLVFEPQKVEIKTMPVDTATFKPHDIKGQIRYPVTFKEVAPWGGGGIALVGLIVLVVWLIMRYLRRNPVYSHKDPAHIVALRKLDKYRGSAMWVPEKQKTFYSGVTDALREYVAARYDVGAMEMTTAEIVRELKGTDVPEELLTELKLLFERADFVKFAKYVASEDENASVLPVAVRFVTETYQAEIDEDGKAMPAQEQSKDGGDE